MNPTDYKAQRELRGTQASVAATLGVNRVTVARRETGEQVITTEAWLALNALPKKPCHGARPASPLPRYGVRLPLRGVQ